MRNKTVLISLMLWAFVLSGCSDAAQQDLVKTRFTTEELLADYDAMWKALETDYVFFPVLEQEGIDVEDIRAGTRQAIARQEPELTAFYLQLEQMFQQLNYFAHLGVVSRDAFDTYQKYYNYEDSPANGWKAALSQPQVQATYTTLLPESDAVATVPAPELECSYDAQRKAVIFHIASFHDTIMERDRDFIQTYLDTLDDAPIEHIVFDITGNPGGNDAYWMEHIVAPFGGSYPWTVWCYLRSTALTSSYLQGSWAPVPIRELPADHRVPDFVAELGLDSFVQWDNSSQSEAQLSGDALTAHRWVVTDNRVYSAADSFADFCKSTGWATLVGQRTQGDGVGITPVLVALPNTGLLIRFSVVTSANSEGRLNACYGTVPDIPSGRYQSPMTTLYQAIDVS